MKALIYGASAQGRVILDILREENRYASIEFVDDNKELWGQELNGARIIGDLERVLQSVSPPFEMVIAVGHPVLRMRLAQKARERSVQFANAVHPSASLMRSATIGVGNMISALASVNSGARLGNHLIVNTAAVVEHDCVLEDYATVCPGVQLGGRSHVGTGAFVATGAIVLPRISIGDGAVVAAGSIVTKPVPERVVVVGAPARIHSRVDESFDWRRLL